MLTCEALCELDYGNQPGSVGDLVPDMSQRLRFLLCGLNLISIVGRIPGIAVGIGAICNGGDAFKTLLFGNVVIRHGWRC